MKLLKRRYDRKRACSCGKDIPLLIARVRELEAAMDVAIPIVEEAFWDHHTAGMFPGAGYNHRVYREVSKAFGWHTTDKFEEWKSLTKQKKERN